MGSSTSWRRFAGSLVLGAALAALPATALSAASAPEAHPAAANAAPPRSLDLPPGALVAPGKAADLELLFTGDVIGYIDPCG